MLLLSFEFGSPGFYTRRDQEKVNKQVGGEEDEGGHKGIWNIKEERDLGVEKLKQELTSAERWGR